MNEQDFQQRLWANPADDSADFVAAANSTPERQSALQEARQFNCALQRVTQQVQAPGGLRDKLLQIPEFAANDDSFIKRLLPVAAVLLIAISIGLYYKPQVNAAMANDFFGHIYLEEPFYGDGSAIDMAEVNARMTPVLGSAFAPGSAGDAFEVTFAKDCYIAKQLAMHLVVKGKDGPVNIVMIPATLVDSEMRIADERFNGMVTPTSGGTLVVVGNKQEPIAEYRDALASSLRWEY